MEDLPLLDFIPRTVSGILRLLDRIDDTDQLTPRQCAAIRGILRLDDPRPVEELIRSGVIVLPESEHTRARARQIQHQREKKRKAGWEGPKNWRA